MKNFLLGTLLLTCSLFFTTTFAVTSTTTFTAYTQNADKCAFRIVNTPSSTHFSQKSSIADGCICSKDGMMCCNGMCEKDPDCPIH